MMIKTLVFSTRKSRARGELFNMGDLIMAHESVQKWLYGTQRNPAMNLPDKKTENSWVQNKRLFSLWRSSEFSAATNLEESD